MWIEENNKLQRTFLFKDFKDAFSFMTEVAAVAEKLNHHPDWANHYRQVRISLCTHEAGNLITEKDRQLAAAIDAIVAGRKPFGFSPD